MTGTKPFRKEAHGGGEPATTAHASNSTTDHPALRHLACLLGRLVAQDVEDPDATQAADAQGAGPTEADAIGSADVSRRLDSPGEDDGR